QVLESMPTLTTELHPLGVVKAAVCAVHAVVSLGYLIQQCLGIFEVSRVEAFREPPIDWCQKVVGVLAFALLLPQASEAGSGTEFPGFSLLALGYMDGVLKTGFGSRGIAR